MASALNLNPPASSAAVHAAVYCHLLWAGAAPRGENHDSERRREQVKCVPGRTNAAFHGALNRGFAVELTREPGERTGVMGEDLGTVEEITTARSERHEQEWRRAMAEKSLGQRGEDRAKKLSGELIDQALDEERDSAEAENLARRPAGAAASQSERDWAWCLEALRRGLDPAIVRARLEERRADDHPNPEYYARRTLERAAAALRREMPAPEIER